MCTSIASSFQSGRTGTMLPSRNSVVQMIWVGMAPMPSPCMMYCLHT